MAQAIGKATIVLPDGTQETHTAEALGFKYSADGAVSIIAACCGSVGGTLCSNCNGVGIIHHSATLSKSCEACGGHGIFPSLGAEDTRSWSTIYDPGMPLSDGKNIVPPLDLAAEVQRHVTEVAQRHAARRKARLSGLLPLMKPKPQPSPAGTLTQPSSAPVPGDPPAPKN